MHTLLIADLVMSVDSVLVAALLGFVAGARLVSGRAVAHGFEDVRHASPRVELAGTIGVVVGGTGLARRKSARADAARV